MKKSAFISDLIFTCLTAFLLSVCFFRYFGVAFPLNLFLSAVCAILATASVGGYMQSKRNSLFLKKSDERKKEQLLLHLTLLSDEQKTQFFQERLPSASELKRFSRLRLYDEERFYLLHFSFAPVTADEVLRFSRLKTGKEKTLLCAKIEEEAQVLAERLKIEVQTGEKIYLALKKKNALPTAYLSVEKETSSRKKLWFSRANAKRFLVASALTLLTAFLSPFPYYYFLFGGILLLSAVLVRVFGYE